jgi:hypothetical protein
MISASVEVLDQDLEAPVTRDDVVLPEERGRLLQHT